MLSIQQQQQQQYVVRNKYVDPTLLHRTSSRFDDASTPSFRMLNHLDRVVVLAVKHGPELVFRGLDGRDRYHLQQHKKTTSQSQQIECSVCPRSHRAIVPPRQQSILPFVHHTFVVTFVAKRHVFTHGFVRVIKHTMLLRVRVSWLTFLENKSLFYLQESGLA